MNKLDHFPFRFAMAVCDRSNGSGILRGTAKAEESFVWKAERYVGTSIDETTRMQPTMPLDPIHEPR
ncbi:MAG TPA: hypothetical protein VGE51_11840 [Fontimonas sp.]